MDVLITKTDQTVRMSDMGFYHIAIDDSAPYLTLDKRSVRGRNGTVYDGMTYDVKEITVTARVAVTSIENYMHLEDGIKGLLLDSEPFYITKMRPKTEGLYDFEMPGQKMGDLNLIGAEHIAWHYRYKVTANKPTFTFIGKTGQSLKYDFSVTFITAEMPFGETEPKRLPLSGGAIIYNGNATYSQLEYPYAVELTATGGQTGFYLTIDGRRFEFKQETPLTAGTVITITGNSTTLRGGGAALATNVTDKTNYEYFKLQPKLDLRIRYETDFKGSIVIVDFKEIYR